MKINRHSIRFVIAGLGLVIALAARAEEPATYEFRSQRKTGDHDHANIALEASGDLLVKSGSGSTAEKPRRQEVGLSCSRDYEEKTLQLPSATDKTLRAVRFYREASAKLHKGTLALNPTLRSDRHLIGVEISGAKTTPFSPRGPLNIDELELLAALGETLVLDQLLPGKPLKVGDSSPVGDETIAVLLGLEEINGNSVQTTLKEVTPEFGRFELSGKVEGKLYGAVNQITLKAKFRFDRQAGRIDWFAMGLQQSRDPSVVESGLDWTVQVKVRVTPQPTCEELSEKALAELPLKSNEDLSKVEHQFDGGEIQLTHDRAWFLTGHYSDQDEFHRLDHGQDIGLCKVAPQPQVGVTKLPTAAQFQEIVQKALGANFGEIVETSQGENAAHLRILRVAVKGKDGETPVQWIYYHVSDPEGRQVTFTFRVEEKNLENFGRADDAIVQSARFVKKVEKK